MLVRSRANGADLGKQQKGYDLGIYRTAAEVAGKPVEADARGAAQAQASKTEAGDFETDKEKLKVESDSFRPFNRNL